MNDDGETLKADRKALSGEGEALKGDGSIEGQWRGVNCNGKALKFDGDALHMMGRGLPCGNQSQIYLGFVTVFPGPVPDIFGIHYMRYQLIWSQQVCSSNLIW